MLNIPTTIKKINFEELYCFDLLPESLREEKKPFRNLGFLFQDFVETIIDEVNVGFESNKVKITHSYNNKPVRGELMNDQIKHKIVDHFSDVFKMNVFKPVIYRNYLTDMPSTSIMDNLTPNDYWVSEFWHSDNEPDNVTRLIVYLDDVLYDGDAPFEWYDDPENTICKFYYDLKYTDQGWKKTRFFDLQEERKHKVFGKKYTSFLFHPNMIHKANFARNKKRDVISLNLQKLPQ